MISELADRLGMDPVAIREKNMVRQGQTAMAYYNEKMTACALDRCMARAKELFGWDGKAPGPGHGQWKDPGLGRGHGHAGVRHLRRGRGIGHPEAERRRASTSSPSAPRTWGLGCDTTLAQVAAECLECDLDNITVYGADTDSSPYDSGSYASSTMYVTGKAVEKAAAELKEHICAIAAGMLGVPGRTKWSSAADRVRRAGRDGARCS